MSNRTRSVDNLVQGVSQQDASQMRDAQCLEQFDCFNSPKDGAVSRNGFEIIAWHDDQLVTNGFFYEIFRGSDEHYLALIVGGDWAVYNLGSGVLCSQSDVGGTAYRTVAPGNLDRDVWAALTLNDTTFVANRTIGPLMDPAIVTPSRPKEAMFFFKAGAYLTRFTIALDHDGNHYEWSYVTPDNSTPSNSAYIDTGQLASTFYRAMTGLVGNLPTLTGVGGQETGDPGGFGFGTPSVLTAPSTLPAGFNMEINGNLLRLWHDTDDFSVDMTDGAGNTLTEAFKEVCRSYSDLPKSGFSGFTLKVQGLKSDAADDFYVAFSSTGIADGVWEETVAPLVETTLKPETMPHGIVITALNTFEWRQYNWSTRIAGDAQSAPVPRFVGKSIQDLFYNKKRLGILTEGAIEWSKSQNPFTHFPDTVQTKLATDRISFDVAAGGTIALCRRTVEVDESLYVWAPAIQFRITNANTESFRAETAEAPVSTFFDFAEKCSFGRIGTALYFATEPGEWVTMRSVRYQQGRAVDELDITAHIPEYIPAGARRISTSDTQRCLTVQTDGAPSKLYFYNYLNSEKGSLQSAWNTWRLPAGTVVWSGLYKSELYAAIQREDGLALVKSNLKSSHKDPGGTYHTRMDMRIDESRVSVTYDSDTEQSTLTIPFNLSEDPSLIRVVLRTTNGGRVRGEHFPVLSKLTPRQLVVAGNLVGAQFYVGLAVSSERHEAEFYLRSDKGPVDTDELTVAKFRARLASTAYTRLEADIGAGRVFSQVWEKKPVDTYLTVGDAPPVPRSGHLDISVNAPSRNARIKLINDSVFPSRWTSAVYTFKAKVSASPASE